MDYNDQSSALDVLGVQVENNWACNPFSLSQRQAMKIIMWIVVGIFLIGLAVVLGLGKLIF